MTHWHLWLLLTLSAPAFGAPPGQPVAEDQVQILRVQTQELLDAVAPGDRATWDRYLHPDLIHIDENGTQRTKAQLVEEIRPLPAGLTGRLEIDRFVARIQGATAVTAYEAQEHLDYHGQTLQSRFRGMDTWLRTAEGWQMIGGHTAVVVKDPPVTRLTPAQLCDYEGVYRLAPSIDTRIRREGDGLRAERQGRPEMVYQSELRDVFFVAGQPRTRRIFLRDDEGRVMGFVDRREGEDISWALVDQGPSGGVRDDGACR